MNDKKYNGWSIKHTDGPWEVSKHATPPSHPQYGVYAENNRNDHCIVRGENAQADAVLIAAAPELLKAILGCIDQLDKETLGGEALDKARSIVYRILNP